ncbi:PfkB family carbohydrate kinase [Pararhizobium gei]|uniref:PfkB family carbohydrate kinase n=1 Tax=Pararhizobium gei TaxID=1395951 RepID=UPI0023DC294D|nr:PfkB family carbohydrate kinase [Rhizobium gei]
MTADGEGVVYADRDGNEIVIPAVKVHVESAHGAGDEFIGVLTAEIASGKTMKCALRNTNSAAAHALAPPKRPSWLRRSGRRSTALKHDSRGRFRIACKNGADVADGGHMSIGRAACVDGIRI